jgi:DNA-binding transcriptional MerR regulator
MSHRAGVYVMQVASMLTGLHPQTLRKYERAGLLTPARRKMLRMYSDEDIARLKMIKHLVNEGLNLAGVEMALKLRAKLLAVKKDLCSASSDKETERKVENLVGEILDLLGTGKRKGGKL